MVFYIWYETIIWKVTFFCQLIAPILAVVVTYVVWLRTYSNEDRLISENTTIGMIRNCSFKLIIYHNRPKQEWDYAQINKQMDERTSIQIIASLILSGGLGNPSILGSRQVPVGYPRIMWTTRTSTVVSTFSLKKNLMVRVVLLDKLSIISILSLSVPWRIGIAYSASRHYGQLSCLRAIHLESFPSLSSRCSGRERLVCQADESLAHDLAWQSGP